MDDETGILVPPDDPRSLATAMRRLLTDPELRQRMGESARARVVRLFEPDDVAKAVVDIAMNQAPNLLSERQGTT
jgi:glycosyltransferase involved in cell wall biosynthesis